MKIKIIELLNRIANGEELPKKFIFDNKTFELEVNETSPKSYYYVEKDRNYLFKTYISDLDTNLLNSEVEIIEEDKTIKELELNHDKVLSEELDLIKDKINELVKEIKKLKEN